MKCEYCNAEIPTGKEVESSGHFFCSTLHRYSWRNETVQDREASTKPTNEIQNLQNETDRLLRRGIFFSFFWLAGFGSLYAVILARKAKRIINENRGEITGIGKVWFCYILGSIGMLIWFPIFITMILNNLR